MIDIEKKNIFPNDQLINIKKNIDKFSNLFESEKVDDLVQIQKDIEIMKNKKYKIDYNKSFLKKYNILELNQDCDINDKDKKKKEKKLDLKFSSDKIKVEYPILYPILKIYEKMCYFLDIYYKNLDYNLILKEKDEYNKLIIFLLFYVTYIKEKEKKEKNKDIRGFTKDIEKFLINCLEN